MNKEFKKVIILTIAAILILAVTLVLALNEKTNLIIYVVMPCDVVWAMFFLGTIFKSFNDTDKERKNSVVFADLTSLELPLFKINEKTNRLFQIYDKNNYGSEVDYSLLPYNIEIEEKEGWSIKLYYVNDLIFVRCYGVDKFNWDFWGVCKKFENKEFIWQLHEDFSEHYEELLNGIAKTKELNHKKLKEVEDWLME